MTLVKVLRLSTQATIDILLSKWVQPPLILDNVRRGKDRQRHGDDQKSATAGRRIGKRV